MLHHKNDICMASRMSIPMRNLLLHAGSSIRNLSSYANATIFLENWHEIHRHTRINAYARVYMLAFGELRLHW